MSLLLLIVYGCCSILLVIYGLNVYLMIALFLRKWSSGDEEIRARDAAFARECVTHPERAPHVTTQLPLFNEYNVAERLIRAVAAMDYPADKHSIQILDDSTDETREVVDAVAAELRARGVDIEVLRRPSRVGYKAGALQYGMKRSAGDLIAIFDADFVPPADFLKRTVPHLLADERRALVQARWGHLNDGESRLTRAQSMGVDGHFVIEQTARCRNGLFMNFCGAAGLWRKRAIVDSGGWQHDTVTEDMDLSYRAQLRGWRLVYLPNLVVPAELPASYTAFKSQQYRWAKGSIQTARKHLRALWSAPLPLLTKFEGTVHLTYYGVHLLMAVLVLLLLPLMLTYRDSIGPFDNWLFLGMLLPAMLGPSLGYLVSQRAAYPDAWGSRTLRLPFLFVVGFGICLSNSKAVLAGIFGSDTTFVRTPKAGEPGQAGRKKKVYTLGRNRLPYLELGLALYCLATLAALLAIDRLALTPFVTIYALGFLVVGGHSLIESDR